MPRLALVAFLVAYHLASGQSRRHLATRAIGIAGVVAVAIGLGHRIFGVSKLYGFLTPSHRSLLIGPFVNSNHTAEFLELAALSAWPVRFSGRPRSTASAGWWGRCSVRGCRGDAFSRCGVGARDCGRDVHAFCASSPPTAKEWRNVVGCRWPGVRWWSVLLVLGAAALGADQLVERFKTDAVTTDVRLQLWRDALRVFAAHPLGIGRGAFDRVYPDLSDRQDAARRPVRLRRERALAALDRLRLALLSSLGGGCGLDHLANRAQRTARQVESALLTGLFAVAVHSTVDFGLETLGVLLPFAAVCGAILGRAPSLDEGWLHKPAAKWAVVTLACFGLTFGIVSASHASYDNFDALLKTQMTPSARQALLTRAHETHPLDYFYVLEDARMRAAQGGARDAFAAPACSQPRAAALPHLRGRARRGGSQSLAARAAPAGIAGMAHGCRSPVEAVHSRAWRAVRQRARPQELAAVASPSTVRLLELVGFLAERSHMADAVVVLDQADALGAPRSESLIVRAGLQFGAGHTAEAAATVAAAQAAGVQDPRLAVLQSEIIVAQRGADGADAALAVLDSAAARTPADTAVQLERVRVVTTFKKWKAANRAVEGLKQALYQKGGQATAAHIADARIKAEMGRGSSALDEYRIALADEPTNVALWVEYARTAESVGHVAAAGEAYAQAARLSPNSPDILAAQRALEQRRAEQRALTIGGQGAGSP